MLALTPWEEGEVRARAQGGGYVTYLPTLPEAPLPVMRAEQQPATAAVVVAPPPSRVVMEKPGRLWPILFLIIAIPIAFAVAEKRER